MIGFTVAQKERLTNLGAEPSGMSAEFGDAALRDKAYKALESSLAGENRAGLESLLRDRRHTAADNVASILENWLIEEEGFTKVSTPTVIPYSMLDRMTVTEDSSLRSQVYDVGGGRCLRPMLAPGLYEVMRELLRITGKTVRIFETGSCFRRDSKGATHLSEFTMLNFVELAGVENGGQVDRLKSLAASAMAALGIQDYEFAEEKSVVYGVTLDVVSHGIEVASGSFGPHVLDDAWGIFDTWTGFGFGIERLAMIRSGRHSVSQVGRSTSFLDGWSLRV